MRVRWVVVAATLALVLSAGPAGAAGPVPNLDSKGSGLRVSLGRILAEHVFLTIEAMRATATDAPDASAATASVEANSVELQAAVGSVYGAAAGRRFGTLWRDHIGHLIGYAKASRTGDASGRDAALQGLTDYRTAFTTFLTDANPNLAPQAFAEALHLHTDQLRAFIDDEDYAAAFAAEREAYGHMFVVGDVLATAIIDQFPKRFDHGRLAFSPSVTLWLTLSRLLGEHQILAAEMMRTGMVGGPAYEAATQALGANTADIATAVGSIYGPDAARAFETFWQDHINAYTGYIDAVRSGDEATQIARRDDLHRYASIAGDFLAKVNPYVESGPVAEMVGHHTQALLDQVDAYRRGDFAAAYGTVRKAHSHMFELAKVLAAAFSAHHPQQFPLPDTATGPAAARSEPAPMIVLWILSLAFLIGTLRRRRTSR